MPVMTERSSKPKKGGSTRRKPPQRTGKPLNVWLQEELRDALDELLGQTRRSLTAEVSIALEEHLKKHGLWPRPPRPSPSTDTTK
jgi:hypothetical protein